MKANVGDCLNLGSTRIGDPRPMGVTTARGGA